MSLRLRILLSWLSIALFIGLSFFHFVRPLLMTVGLPVFIVLNMYLRAPFQDRCRSRTTMLVLLVLLIPPLLAAIALVYSASPVWLFHLASVPLAVYLLVFFGCRTYDDYRLLTGRDSLE